MGQMGFFDIANRYAGLDAKNDPLARIDAVVPWENFRARLEEIWRKPAEERKSPAGRKPWDAVAMFKAIVLCELYTDIPQMTSKFVEIVPLVHRQGNGISFCSHPMA